MRQNCIVCKHPYTFNLDLSAVTISSFAVYLSICLLSIDKHLFWPGCLKVGCRHDTSHLNTSTCIS